MEVSREKVLEHCEEWTMMHIGTDFKFREYQKEVIANIIMNVLNKDYHNYIIEAPTGSGKSLINIIAACVLAQYYDIESYILCSDLFLWEQYNQFLKKHKDLGVAILKGQTGNYECLLNGEDLKNADCRMAGLSWPTLYNPSKAAEYGYDCAAKCEYVRARRAAIKAKVCIMTYQLFLFIMNNPNFNRDAKGMPIFRPHEVLFCDECHNIPSIVQLQYSPTVITEHFDKLVCLYNGTTQPELSLFVSESIDYGNLGMDSEDTIQTVTHNNIYHNLQELKEVCYKCWDVWKNPESIKKEDYDMMNLYYDILKTFVTRVEDIKQAIRIKKENHEKLTKDDMEMFRLCSWHENTMCHWNDFLNALSMVGYEYLLKDITVANDDKHISTAFKCTKEDVLVYIFLLKRSPYKVFLSATIGGKKAFDDNMGFQYENEGDFDSQFLNEHTKTNESYLERVPSTFDFSKSPIHFLNKFKMSFHERELSFKHLKTIIYTILKNKFQGQKGMIQTGSYEFAERLYKDAPFEIKQRMLTYNGSREKKTVIDIHKMSDDTILVGPTLNTGIDLPGDECRFIIIMKVPYPSLADRLVKEKNRLFPLWYNSQTSNEIIQGIGRGVRYNGDWCVTYILDSCFNTLYRSTKEQYPQELQDRINYI